MKILVLNSYTKKQKYKPDNLIRREDLSPPEHLDRRIRELSGYNAEGSYHESRDYSVRAGDMFTSQFHEQVRKGLTQVRNHEEYGETTLDLYFPANSNFCRVDRREPLVNEKHRIVPFDIEPLHDHDWEGVDYGETALLERVEALMESYDLVFSLLAKYDVLELKGMFERHREVPLVLLAPPGWRISIPESLPNTHLVCTGAKDLVGNLAGATNYNLRGAVFRKLCEVACREGFHVFEEVRQNPQRILDIVLEHN